MPGEPERLLAAANALFIALGFVRFEDTGYASVKGLGTERELWLGVLILLIGVALFVFRRVVQDKARFTKPLPAGRPAAG